MRPKEGTVDEGMPSWRLRGMARAEGTGSGRDLADGSLRGSDGRRVMAQEGRRPGF